MNKKILKWNMIFQYGYVLTNIFNSIVLLPLYLKNIDSATLGIWLATGNILAWMTLADPGVGDVLQQKIAELRGKSRNTEIGKTIGSGFIASGIILVLSVLVGFIFYMLIGVIINKDVSQYPNLQIALALSIIATGMSLVSFSMSGINQGMHNSAQVAIASLIANGVFLVVNVMLLYFDFGVISIAFANLCRALFINVYNISSMQKLLKRERLKINFDFTHFKKFIRIFSFTSASRIVGGFSASMDMIVLARFLPPAMITIFEINKRPIGLSQSLVGRHSVALMPLISHAKGTGNRNGIIDLINKQFKFYSYATLFISLMFILSYENLITTWTGTGRYAGDTIMYLLVANFFFGLIGYFMANMGYALGDIKRNSLVNIVKGVVLGVLLFFVARKYGIIGTLAVMLAVTLATDFSYFTYRLYKLGYLQSALLKGILNLWSIILPCGLLIGWGCRRLVDSIFSEHMHLPKLLVSGTLFTISFMLLLLLVDSELRSTLRLLKDKFITTSFLILMRT
ncbi:MAG: MATE family efflux transporter [Chitinophagaceae bacterium]